MRSCDYCKKEFESVSRGSEQKYCSRICRSRAAQNRFKEKLKNDGKGIGNVFDSISEQVIRSSGSESGSRVIRESVGSFPDGEREVFGSQSATAAPPFEVVRYLEQTYEARANALKFELKYEQALKELNECRLKLAELEEEEEEEEGAEGIGAILQNIPPWMGAGLGKLLENEKVQKFIVSQFPDK